MAGLPAALAFSQYVSSFICALPRAAIFWLNGIGSGGSRPPGTLFVIVRSGPPPGAFRLGGSCVSHGMFGRKTGRLAGRVGRTAPGGAVAGGQTGLALTVEVGGEVGAAGVWARVTGPGPASKGV